MSTTYLGVTVTTAEDVFRIAKAKAPEKWAEVEAEHPVSDSYHDDKRHETGMTTWEHRQQRNAEYPRSTYGYGGSFVPKDQRRTFTDEEWAEVESARALELPELRRDWRSGYELASDGLLGIHANDHQDDDYGYNG